MQLTAFFKSLKTNNSVCMYQQSGVSNNFIWVPDDYLKHHGSHFFNNIFYNCLVKNIYTRKVDSLVQDS